ncbi:MAG: 30S ribosomal protein S16 [Deltaproteobacteria bacterium]|nr:30S ribosomal protein S16 [Deltaproteobacteria bacterium]
MAVVLRLARHGTRHRPFYHIVATDSRNKRDGSFIESVGIYDPIGATQLAVDEEKAKKWLKVGARQSNIVKSLLARAGVTA